MMTTALLSSELCFKAELLILLQLLLAIASEPRQKPNPHRTLMRLW